MSNSKDMFNQVLEDLELDARDMMTSPKDFISRVYAKSLELARQLDAKSTISEYERTFKDKAMKNETAKHVAKVLFDKFYTEISEQEPEVLVNFLAMLPDITSMCQSSIRSMSMRSGDIAGLSKKQINLMYIRLKKTYETYIDFMKLFHEDEIGIPPVIVPKKGNFSDSGAGIKTYAFIVDGDVWYNPFPVAKKLGINMQHYMDLPDAIKRLNVTYPTINGYKVELRDISKDSDA